MKKFTRFFATVAAVSMVAASLAGCGSKSDNTAYVLCKRWPDCTGNRCSNR